MIPVIPPSGANATLLRHSYLRRRFLQMPAPLENGHAGVEVHRQRGPGEISHWQRAPGPISVQLVQQALAQLDKCGVSTEAAAVLVPIGGVKVLDDVEAIGSDTRVEILKLAATSVI